MSDTSYYFDAGQTDMSIPESADFFNLDSVPLATDTSIDSGGWTETDWANFLKTAGQTALAVKQGWNQPQPGGASFAPPPSSGAPSMPPMAAPPPGAPPATTPSASSSSNPFSTFTSNITNFKTPYPYIAIGGGLLLVGLIARRR